MTLYQPLVPDAGIDPIPLSVVQNSVKSVETLLRVYYLRHGFESLFSILCQPLAFIAFMCLDRLEMGKKQSQPQAELESIRSTLFLAVKGLGEQGKSHYLGRTLFRVFTKKMKPEEAALLKSISSIPDEDEEAGKRGRTQAVHSRWPMVRESVHGAPKDVLSELVRDVDQLKVQ